MSKKTACAFYEVNTGEMAEHEAYLKNLSEEEREGYARMAVYIASENTVCTGCGEFCKYMDVDEGPMYETLYLCTAPGNEHIIGAESDDTEERYEM